MQTHSIHIPAAEPPVNVQVVGPQTPVVARVVAILRKRGTGAVSTELGRALQNLRKRCAIARKLRQRGKPHWRGLGVQHVRRFDHMRRPDLYLVNCLHEDGTSPPAEVARAVFAVRRQSTGVPIVALIDETNADALRAAREAGATSFIGAGEAENEEAVSWRVSGWTPRVPQIIEEPPPADPARPSPREIAAAIAAVNTSVSLLPTPAARLARAAGWVRVDAPHLRDAESGRFNAKRIAAALGISLARLAPATGATQQALSTKPDSAKAQAGLASVARVLAALDELLPAEQRRMWLNTPHARFGGRTPLTLIEAGDAEALARAVEAALEGDPG